MSWFVQVCFQSSYPCLIVGAVSCFALPSSPLALTCSLPPHAPMRHISPISISANIIVMPPLTDNVKYIDSGLRFSFPQQVHPMPLDVLLSPLSSCLQKQEIVQNDPANRSSSCCQERWRCCHPKARSVYQPDAPLEVEFKLTRLIYFQLQHQSHSLLVEWKMDSQWGNYYTWILFHCCREYMVCTHSVTLVLDGVTPSSF